MTTCGQFPWLRLAFVCFLCVSVAACAARRSRGPSAPDSIRIAIAVKDYRIVDYRVVSSLGSIKHLHGPDIFSDGELAYYRLTPDIEDKCNCYYIARVPPYKSGDHVIVASKFQRLDPGKPLPPPPYQFQIAVKIENGMITAQRIQNITSTTFGMSVAGHRWQGLNLVVTIESRLYRKEMWEAVMPTDDGNHTVIATRIIQPGS